MMPTEIRKREAGNRWPPLLREEGRTKLRSHFGGGRLRVASGVGTGGWRTRFTANTYAGVIRVLNAHAYRNRRIRKTVQWFHSTIAPPPSASVGILEWETLVTYTLEEIVCEQMP